MASRRAVKRKQCGNKIRFNSQTEAVGIGISLMKKKKIHVVSYKCSFCNGWHLGHNRKSGIMQQLYLIKAKR